MRARSFFSGVWLRLALASCVILACNALAATEPAPELQSAMDALNKAHAAVVGVHVTAADEARSAETLGQRRRGSGVVIGPEGLILTIGYLILEADSIQVVTQDNHVLPAAPVAYDLATGFGLIKAVLPLRGVSPVALGSQQDLSPGERLMAVSGGEDSEVAITQLVSKRAFSGYWEYHIDAALFTSPPIGNHSGAALFNRRGELLGIGSLFVADALGQRPPTPGNMFVPVDLLKPILGELQRTGSSTRSRRPWLGLTSGEQGGHVIVVRVAKGSPAETAGIGRGDTVLAVDGEPVGSLEAFYKRIWAHPNPEDEMKLTVVQGGQTRTLTLRGVDRMSTMAKPAGI